MNRTISPYSTNVYTRVCRLAARVATPDTSLAFLVHYLSLWRRELRPVPMWLLDAARRFNGREPDTAAMLYRAARLEALHRLELAKDVAELERTPIAADMLAAWTPTEAVERHMFIRTMVSPEDPMTIVAIDHHHGSLDAISCRALLYAMRDRLPKGVHARRFLDARATDATKRVQATKVALDGARARLGDNARTRSWTDIAVDVMDSYVDALDSYVDPRTASREVTPPASASASASEWLWS